MHAQGRYGSDGALEEEEREPRWRQERKEEREPRRRQERGGK